jgi:CHAT domain-containing protein
MKYRLFVLLFFIINICLAQDSLPYFNTKITTSFKKKDFKTAEFFFRKKINTLKKQNNLEDYYYAHLDFFALNSKLNRLSLLDVSEWRQPNSENEKIAKLHTNIYKARFLLDYGNISASVKAYENAFHYYQSQSLKNYDIIEYCLKPLGNNYTRLGDYERAEEIFKYTLQLLEQNNNTSQQISAYQNLSIAYQTILKNKDAIRILEKALEIKAIKNEQKASIYIQIAKNYFELKNYTKSYDFSLKTFDLTKNKRTILSSNLNIAAIYIKTKQYNKALKLLYEGVEFAKKINSEKREIAKIHNVIASVYVFKKAYKDALKSYKIAINTLIPKFSSRRNSEDSKSDYFIAENTLKDAFDGKALVYEFLNDAKNAIKNYGFAIEVEQFIKIAFVSQQAKISLQTENRLRSEKLVRLFYQLFLDSNDNSYLKKAFQTVEKSKATVLSDIINEKYLQQGLKQDSLITKQQILQKNIALLSNNIILEELKEQRANLNNIKRDIAKKTKFTTELSVLKQQISAKYPFLKNSKAVISINDIQQQILKKNQILIEFFETKNQIYIFSVTKFNMLSVRQFQKDAVFNSAITSYLNLFSNASDASINNNIDIYLKTANYLYNKLLQPELLKFNPSDITIIPDGKLNFLPFDALLTKQTDVRNFKNLPYLLYQNTINYGFSSSILLQQKKQSLEQKSRTKTIGFFPVFENDYRDLQELTYTLNEKDYVNRYNNPTLLEKDKATKAQFLAISKNYDIIHLSTHASAGSFFEPAHIEFREQTLHLPEIYGLNLNSDLLVMSACETGIGKLQKGEGAMSLARGFSYAGIQNLIVSQWKVNDKSTSILMRNFYKNYAKTKNKNLALHQAKLDYLNDESLSQLKKSPYYWSSFIFIGNSQITKTVSYFWWYLIAGIGVLLLVVWFLKRRR